MSLILDGQPMDGQVHSYMPEPHVRISGDVRLDRRVAPTIDPITYEVIRYSLWNVNEEHGVTIQNVSGSGIAKYARDFNPCIMTEDAEYVYFGQYMPVHSGVQDLIVRWTLEYLGENPGIDPGDMFLCNDPWIGATHQSDTSVICPVFWEGSVFCWVANTMHFADLGGVRPGGWSPSAEDVYWEPRPTPPLKVVDGGYVRRDIERLWARQSRVPDLTALDLRALIAGNSVAKCRIEALLQKYGVATVKATMRKIIDDAERAFLEKLDCLPDGQWSDRAFMEVSVPDDRNLYCGALTMTKTDKTLTFTNAGTDPVSGVLNSTYSGWRSSILGIVSALLCHDSLGSVGGALRHIDFHPVPGTLTSADYPAAVSSGVIFASANTLTLATTCINSMLACSPDTATDISCSGGIGHFPIDSLSGHDQYDSYFTNAILDFNAAPMGAGVAADGVSSATPFWACQTIAPNVEDNEQVMPILYLWRRERCDSAGAGKHIGGASLESAYIPHGVEQILHQLAACGLAIPTSTGIGGGFPGASNRFALFRDSNVLDLVRNGRLPSDLADLRGSHHDLGPKMVDVIQGSSDVFIVGASGGGGLGDPLERPPEQVVEDVQRDDYSVEWARMLFGVVLTGDGRTWDAERTDRERGAMRAARLAGMQPTRRESPETAARFVDTPRTPVVPALCFQQIRDACRLSCARCGAGLGDGKDNYKEYCVSLEIPLAAALPLEVDPRMWVDDDIVLRTFACPRCAALVDSEVARPHDDPIQRSRLVAIGDA